VAIWDKWKKKGKEKFEEFMTVDEDRPEPYVIEDTTEIEPRLTEEEMLAEQAKLYSSGGGDAEFAATRGRSGNYNLTLGGQTYNLTPHQFMLYQTIASKGAVEPYSQRWQQENPISDEERKVVMELLSQSKRLDQLKPDMEQMIIDEYQATRNREALAEQLKKLETLEREDLYSTMTDEEALAYVGLKAQTLTDPQLLGEQYVEAGAKGIGGHLATKAARGMAQKAIPTGVTSTVGRTAMAAGALLPTLAALAVTAGAYTLAVSKGQKLNIDQADRVRANIDSELPEVEKLVASGANTAEAIQRLQIFEESLIAANQVLKMIETDRLGSLSDARMKRSEVLKTLQIVQNQKRLLSYKLQYPDTTLTGGQLSELQNI